MASARASSEAPRAAGADASVVKSAGRALQILEFFDSVQREACVSEVSRALQWPQSSTSVLLRSLVHMGYLQNDRYRRTYYPTRRVPLLGNWVDPTIVRQGDLLLRADELSAQTGRTVVIATLNGLRVQLIYVSTPQGPSDGYGSLHVGMHSPLARSALGKALLSGHGDKQVSQMTWRINGERSESEPLIHTSELLADLELGRGRGWFSGEGSDGSRSAVAVLLECERQSLAIGIEQWSPMSEAQALDYAERLTGLAAQVRD